MAHAATQEGAPVSDQIVKLRFEASPAASVSALLLRPVAARLLYAFGHGAGAGMEHRFMDAASACLAEHGIASLRYQFPYMEAGSRRPDARNTLLATVRAAVEAAAAAAPDLALLAGGKSMGGRMTSLAAAELPLPGVRGLVFFGFPLHPAGRPSVERAAHLDQVGPPMLFLQGDRDKLAELDLLGPICAGLGERATLHVVPGADHSFHMLKRLGRTDDEVLDELARTVADWSARLILSS
jgi:predicted alpha/beta-hydrolase family hydrolase